MNDPKEKKVTSYEKKKAAVNLIMIPIGIASIWLFTKFFVSGARDFYILILSFAIAGLISYPLDRIRPTIKGSILHTEAIFLLCIVVFGILKFFMPETVQDSLIKDIAYILFVLCLLMVFLPKLFHRNKSE